MNEGTIYCVRNPLFPHLVKIGKTKHFDWNDRGLSATNVPEDFEKIFSYRVSDMDAVEKSVHQAVDEFRYRGNAERQTEFFYACAIEKAEKCVLPFKIDNEENESSEDTAEETGRRKRRKFSDLNLPVGTELEFSMPNNAAHGTKVITVDTENKVKLPDGQEMSLSAAASYLSTGTTGKPMQGSKYFKYNGDLISDSI